MLVGTLTQFLLSLSAPLEISGASRKVLDDLEKTVKALDRFHEWKVEDLATLLVKADEYDRTGIFTPAPGTKKPASPRKPKATKMSAEEALAHARNLFDTADAEHMTHDIIAAEVKKLDPLSVKDLNHVAKELGLATSSKAKKADILAAIQDKIATRRSTFLRTQF